MISTNPPATITQKKPKKSCLFCGSGSGGGKDTNHGCVSTFVLTANWEQF